MSSGKPEETAEETKMGNRISDDQMRVLVHLHATMARAIAASFSFIHRSELAWFDGKIWGSYSENTLGLSDARSITESSDGARSTPPGT